MNFSKTILLLPFIFLTATPVQAENRIKNRIEERQEIRQENQEDRGEMHQEIKENRQELRTTIVQDKLILRRQNAIKIANNLVTKLEKRFEYLNKIKVRLQSKIDALKTTRNMTEAQAKLNSYNPTKYTTDLKALDPIIASISSVEKPNSVIPTLREAAKLVLNDLKDLHQVLVDALKLMVKSPKITLTTTPTPSL